MRITNRLGNKKKSQISEKQAAQIFKGRVQPASGAIDRFDLKADVISDKFLVDDKVTNGKSFTLSSKLWTTLCGQAWMNRRKPVIRINFIGGQTAYVIDETTMQEILNES